MSDDVGGTVEEKEGDETHGMEDGVGMAKNNAQRRDALIEVDAPLDVAFPVTKIVETDCGHGVKKTKCAVANLLESG